MADVIVRESFQTALRSLINEYSREDGSNTPDFILSEYIDSCLNAFDQAVRSRERWYNRERENDPLYKRTLANRSLFDEKSGDTE